MSDIILKIREKLISLADEKYKDFQSALMPTVDKNRVIGVRMPILRELAKRLKDTDDGLAFLNDLPHKYYEEDNLHAFILCYEKDFDRAVERLDEFLSYVDNWATCDSMRIKAFERNIKRTEAAAFGWLFSRAIYQRRFAVITFMKFFTDEHFDKKQADVIAAIRTDEYYVNSAIAWYFATLLSKRYQDALPYFIDKKLGDYTHNFAIKKALESNAIAKNIKDYLRTLKI